MTTHIHSRRATSNLPLVIVLLLPAALAGAVELEDPGSFEVAHTWSGTSVGVPGRLGAMMFSADGMTLYVVGNSEASSSALYAVPVTRDSKTREVTELGPANAVTLVFDGSLTGLDTGLEVGPDGTLFYTYWRANHMGQRPGGFSGAETVYDMATVGVPSSVAGLTFSPHVNDNASGFGQMQVSSWQGDNLYNIPLTASGAGLFKPGNAVLFATLPQQGTGAIQYVPSGKLAGNLMYVNWDFGEVRVLHIDTATGLPIDADSGEPTLGTKKPVDERFAYDMGVGPWGLEFDAETRDFFVSTWDGAPANSIIHFTGPGFTEPPTTDGGAGTDAGSAADAEATDGGAAARDRSSGGCGCRVQEPRGGAGTALSIIILLALFVRGRRCYCAGVAALGRNVIGNASSTPSAPRGSRRQV